MSLLNSTFPYLRQSLPIIYMSAVPGFPGTVFIVLSLHQIQTLNVFGNLYCKYYIMSASRKSACFTPIQYLHRLQTQNVFGNLYCKYYIISASRKSACFTPIQYLHRLQTQNVFGNLYCKYYNTSSDQCQLIIPQFAKLCLFIP